MHNVADCQDQSPCFVEAVCLRRVDHRASRRISTLLNLFAELDSFPPKERIHNSLRILPTLSFRPILGYASHTKRRQKKGPGFGEKSQGQAPQGLKGFKGLSFGSRRTGKCFGRARYRSTPRRALSQRRLAARAFYSRIFCPVTWKAAGSG